MCCQELRRERKLLSDVVLCVCVFVCVCVYVWVGGCAFVQFTYIYIKVIDTFLYLCKHKCIHVCGCVCLCTYA